MRRQYQCHVITLETLDQSGPGICPIVLMSQTQIPGLSHPRYCHHHQQYKMWWSGCLMYGSDNIFIQFMSHAWGQLSEVGLSTACFIKRCLSAFVDGSMIMYRSCCSQMQLTTCSWAANIGFLQNFPHKVCALQHNFGELMRATPHLKPGSVRFKYCPLTIKIVQKVQSKLI